MALTVVLAILFSVAVALFQLKGFPSYVIQLGIYLIFYLLAWWGLKWEQITLPINAWLILEALVWSLVGWLFFVLLIQLLGLTQLSEEFQTLKNTPAWIIGAQILSDWFFVGMGEEVLFRGYFLQAFRRHFTSGTNRRRTVVAILLVSAFFSLWHLPIRISWLISGKLDLVMLLVSLLVVFLLGIGFAYLFVRSDNILLAGLVHGVVNFPVVGMNSQISPIILVVAIGCVEISRLTTRRKVKAMQQ
jgi:membrane protease YdiL (CAAX protease family)